jgi:hypothetical protein
MRRFSREQHRALEVLAEVPRGISEEVLMLAHGFSSEMIAGLVKAGLAIIVTQSKTMRPGVTIEIERIQITDAGRRAIEK